MKYEIYENETYNLYTITTNKFKSVHAEVVFISEATKENITYLSLLTSMLTENYKDCPSRKLLVRKEMDLYNANVYAVNSRVGRMIVTNFVLDFVDPKYTSKDMLEESLKLLFDMILNPNVSDDEFDNTTFEIVKRRIMVDIEALKEDPKQSSILEAFQELNCKDERGLNVTGDIDILKTITSRKLYKFYKNFLENAKRDVYLIGEIEPKTIDKVVRKYANFKSIPSGDADFFLAPIKVRSPKMKSRSSSLTQTQLVEIYAINDEADDEVNYVIPLFNMIFGSGSLESKLYKSLRGENSLCYNVNTFYQKYDRVLILHTAIDDSKFKLAEKLIGNAFNQMCKGLFSEEELDNAKNIMVNSLNMVLDSPNRIVDNCVFKNLVGLPDLEDRIDEIRNVTKADIIDVSKKIKKVCVYRVKGDA